MNTEILVITDRSGSMSNIAKDVIGGYNTFIEDQQKVSGDARVTFTQFDTEYEVVYAGEKLADVPKLDSKTFVPRGGTALLDAIGRTLNEQGQRISADKWAELVIVCILTDGEENSSKEFTRDQVKAMTSYAETNGWKFVYLGANQDSFSVASNLGMKNAFTANYAANAAGTKMAYESTSAMVRRFRSS